MIEDLRFVCVLTFIAGVASIAANLILLLIIDP